MKVSCFLLCLVIFVAFVDAKKKSSRIKRYATSCNTYEFMCSTGACISRYWLCDTVNDCGNNEDEIGCPTDCSGQNQVRCNNHNCVPLEDRCDGDNDCLDNTDETGCDTYNCQDDKVKCPNTHLCIPRSWLCDGNNDCGDNWDEQPANCHS